MSDFKVVVGMTVVLMCRVISEELPLELDIIEE